MNEVHYPTYNICDVYNGCLVCGEGGCWISEYQYEYGKRIWADSLYAMTEIGCYYQDELFGQPLYPHMTKLCHIARIDPCYHDVPF